MSLLDNACLLPWFSAGICNIICSNDPKQSRKFGPRPHALITISIFISKINVTFSKFSLLENCNFYSTKCIQLGFSNIHGKFNYRVCISSPLSHLC